MAESVVVTDGTDSFYGSRTLFQFLHDFGEFDKITAFGPSVVDAKKMLLSRQARYSGLVDVLEFAEGEHGELSGASTWVAVNGDPSQLPGQIKAAEGAGVKRALIHVVADAETAGVVSSLEASSLTYTLMRTGELTKAGEGGGLILEEVDHPTCESVPIDDVFRFITEALTMDEASGRSFALCPATDATQLRKMRMAGCSRREEVAALLKGQIKLESDVIEASPEEVAAKTEEDEKTAKELEAKREEELKELLARAKQRGIENQKRMAEEEAEKKKKREERLAMFARPDEDDGDDKDAPAKEEPPPPEEPKKTDDKKDDDDDGLALV